MKFKQIEKSGVMCWSPCRREQAIVVATACQQLDANFGSDSKIDLFDLNLKEATLGTTAKYSTDAGNASFTCIGWHPSGAMICGTQSSLQLRTLNENQVRLEYESVSKQPQHPSSVNILDINPIDNGLVATGSNEGSVTVWDISSASLTPKLTLSPVTSSPGDEILGLEWNRQVPSILASASNNNVYVYDTRKKDQTTPIMRVFDSNAATTWGPGPASVMYSKAIAWSHIHSTTLLVANSNDANPMLQLWDLRYSSSPIKYMRGGHTRGIISISWNSFDEEIVLSAAKDNSICVWNPAAASNEDPLLAFLPEISNHWINDLKWSPWEPSLFAVGSFDGHTTVYNITQTNLVNQASNQISESFGLDSPFLPHQQPSHVQPQTQQKKLPVLPKAPKWMRVPCGASWGFGGKLLTYQRSDQEPTQQPHEIKHSFAINQVVTDPDFLAKTDKLDNAINNENLFDFCSFKTNEHYSARNEALGLAWRFLGTHFYTNEAEKTDELLTLLGFAKEESLSGRLSGLNISDESNGVIENHPFDDLSEGQRITGSSVSSPERISSPLLTPSMLQEKGLLPLAIQTNEEKGQNLGHLINKCILTGNVEKAIESCISEGCWSEALLLCWFSSPEHLAPTLKKYFSHSASDKHTGWSSLLWLLISDRVSSESCSKDETVLQQLVANVDLDYWREALAFIMKENREDYVYQKNLINVLADRLLRRQQEDGIAWVIPALYCFILSGNYESIARFCSSACGTFFNLVEVLLILQKANPGNIQTPAANELLAKYAAYLAGEGKMETSLKYLRMTGCDEELKRRIELHLQPPQTQQATSQMGRVPVGRARAYPNAIATQPREPQHNYYGQQRPPISPVGPPPSGQYRPQPSTTPAPPYGPPPPSHTPVPTTPPVATVEPFSSYPQHQPYAARGALPPPPQQQPQYQQQQQYYPQPMQTVMEAPLTGPPVAQPYSYASGWNDPPPTFKVKSKHQPTSMTPISAPIAGYDPQPVGPPVAAFTPMSQNQPQSRRGSFNVATPPPPSPPPVLTPEDQQLFDVYENLLMQIQEQVKVQVVPLNLRRKLEDVRLKLDILRSRLGKSGQMSASTLTGLREMAAAVNRYDYNAAMAMHGDLVATTGFGESAAFLPAIKVLLHLAQQFIKI